VWGCGAFTFSAIPPARRTLKTRRQRHRRGVGFLLSRLCGGAKERGDMCAVTGPRLSQREFVEILVFKSFKSF
jgi:hypothetical protein